MSLVYEMELLHFTFLEAFPHWLFRHRFARKYAEYLVKFEFQVNIAWGIILKILLLI